MKKTIDDFIAELPPSLEPEFIMMSADEPLRLAVGKVDLSRDGQVLGQLDGELTLQWIPNLRIVCTGDADAALNELLDDRPLSLGIPQLGLEAEALVTSVQMGQRHEMRALVMGVENVRLTPTDRFRFYLVNFPTVFGEAVRRGNGPLAGAGRDRLRLTAGTAVCTIDRIHGTKQLDTNSRKPGYLLTHIGQVERPGQPFTPAEVHELLDALYWLFAFLRGARTGPVLPSVDSPFVQHWISIAPWAVDEPRFVESWLPDRSPINLDALFTRFVEKWADREWNEGLRTTLAWYITANAPSTPNEARIPLCQIALEVLASLRGLEGGPAHTRIRTLLQGQSISTDVPARLPALARYAAGLSIDAPESLTRIRNKFEHPTAKNREHAGTVDGTTRMQAAQYGLELFELCLLAIMDYRGNYAQRAFQGWKGDDEVPVPWM